MLVLVLSLVPMVSLLNQGGEQPWQLWLPGLAQISLMNRVLEGGALGPAALLPPLLTCGLLAALALADVAHQLRGAALR